MPSARSRVAPGAAAGRAAPGIRSTGPMRAAVVALALLTLASGCRVRRADRGAFHPLDIGSAVPSYAAPTLSGDTVRLGGAEAPTVVNVWATWCTSCAEEMATLTSLSREFEPRGVRVVGISVDDGSDTRVQRYVESHHIEFPIVHDPGHIIESRYALMGVPTTFVIGRDGRLVWRYTGNVQDALADAERAINSTLTAR